MYEIYPLPIGSWNSLILGWLQGTSCCLWSNLAIKALLDHHSQTCCMYSYRVAKSVGALFCTLCCPFSYNIIGKRGTCTLYKLQTPPAPPVTLFSGEELLMDLLRGCHYHNIMMVVYNNLKVYLLFKFQSCRVLQRPCSNLRPLIRLLDGWGSKYYGIYWKSSDDIKVAASISSLDFQ